MEQDLKSNGFLVSNRILEVLDLPRRLFFYKGGLVFSSQDDINTFVFAFNHVIEGGKFGGNSHFLDAGNLAIMAVMNDIFHHVLTQYTHFTYPNFFSDAYSFIEKRMAEYGLSLDSFMRLFEKSFFNLTLSANKENGDRDGIIQDSFKTVDETIKPYILEKLFLLVLLKENPAISRFSFLFEDESVTSSSTYKVFKDAMSEWAKKSKSFDSSEQDIISFLNTCTKASKDNLKTQLAYIKNNWQPYIKDFEFAIFMAESIARESWRGDGAISYLGEHNVPTFQNLNGEEEKAFSKDCQWMEGGVMLAKNTYVYLYQLSKKYGKEIARLDEIPDAELKDMQEAGITALWLIGIWERSTASAKIKRKCGNIEAIGSAYSIGEYKIAKDLGGLSSLLKLKEMAEKHGIRLSADMVPNHTAIDSKEVINAPHLFLQTKNSPYPSYEFSGEDLSCDKNVSIYLEDHYYSKTDCAVVFKRVDNNSKEVSYIYHGNDGTGMPWNDTAQLDFLNSEVRERVIEQIIEIAKVFPIIRFDAAMTLTQRHIRRLWYPFVGASDFVPSRLGKGISDDEFYRRMPGEFWREVVDRIAKEAPDTLLLAEAFWMLEGYFVRTLGMHRVYNSAFMNMLKNEENEKYRNTIKNTLGFDREVLKRYVNFMSNPDEESAARQFGKGDKYFGICTMMATLPGLPMFSHGQFLGRCEKYGMEYKKAYLDEDEDLELLERHKREIFPLLKKRALFSGVENFYFYDVVLDGKVNENVFAWSNRHENEKALIFYNNKYERASGWISVPFKDAREELDMPPSLLGTLNLSDGILFYTIFYEMRSGLYYIRANSELKEKGFFVMLQGFETQVFVDIWEVFDRNGEYKKLYESLKGRGMKERPIL